MITVKVTKKNGNYVSFTSSGHAGYADEGYDIFCAAVSALTINTVNSLEEFTEEKFEAEDRDGYISIRFHGENTYEGKLLMDSLLLGLTQIEHSYQRQYLQVKVREV